ncbi:MAG: carbohydrate ABC transporter permease [Ardenticatenaceae bacterium]|nr:carbohydrate ABC transporter permease [Ardenticatenaceae bacterium]HBY98937.1 carbohydrate ABC transporter permease [Chloroflexota bacterium]
MAIGPAFDSAAVARDQAERPAGGRLARGWWGWLVGGVRYVLMTLAALFFIIPFLWMFLASFKPQLEIFQYIYPLNWKTFIPQTWTLENYRGLMALNPFPFTHYIANSVFVAVAVTLSSLVVNAMAAYAFARLDFPGRNVLFALFLSTMIIPFEALAIPLYLEMKTLNWVDTYQALIVPWIANALGIFLLRQFFLDIPRDLVDAARIDGCSHLSAFRYVVIPNAIPALITFALIRFQASWDAFFWPLIVAPGPEKRVVQVAIATFATEVQTQWGLTFAASTFATLPIILLFLLLQRYYVRGVVMSGLKG